MSPLAWFAFVVAGAAGAVLRHVVGGAVTERLGRRFPWGTFVVNVTGSFLLGLVTGLALYHALPDTPAVVVGTGFVGASTTFSTLSYEAVLMAEEGVVAGGAVAYLLVTLAAGTGAAAIGLALAAI